MQKKCRSSILSIFHCVFVQRESNRVSKQDLIQNPTSLLNIKQPCLKTINKRIWYGLWFKGSFEMTSIWNRLITKSKPNVVRVNNKCQETFCFLDRIDFDIKTHHLCLVQCKGNKYRLLWIITKALESGHWAGDLLAIVVANILFHFIFHS